ncbi:MAG: hypothetical protein OXG42_07215, partial [Chloroflexi bacterium]|nr:hypothetical protein [Chloroflexota bacterium]
MTTATSNANEPPPEDEDRSVLFGPPKEGAEPAGDRGKPRRPDASASPPPGTSPPAAGTEAEPPDPAARPEPAASTDAVQRQTFALLEELREMVAGSAAREADLAASARTIAEQIGAATEWINDINAAISTVLASSGKQIEGLNSGNKNLDAALARLNILKEGLAKVVQALDATAKGLDRRSSELQAVKQDLAKYYGAWTGEAKTSLAEMKALSQRLDAGDHMVTRLEQSIGPWTERMEKSIGASSAAQLDAAEKTAGNLRELATTGSQFLRDFAATRGRALREARQEWTRIRRWTLPALAIALALAMPISVVAGALGQSEYGIFKPYDDTGGWKDGVWNRYGKQVQDCMLKSWRAERAIR